MGWISDPSGLHNRQKMPLGIFVQCYSHLMPPKVGLMHFRKGLKPHGSRDVARNGDTFSDYLHTPGSFPADTTKPTQTEASFDVVRAGLGVTKDSITVTESIDSVNDGQAAYAWRRSSRACCRAFSASFSAAAAIRFSSSRKALASVTSTWRSVSARLRAYLAAS